MESRTASGLLIEHRAAFPRDPPNENPPESVSPATVGPNVYQPGDSQGVGIVPYDPPVRVQPWSGWPAEWQTPNWWGSVNRLTDTAWACLDLNSRVLATMPPYLVGASSSLSADWINNPDPDQYPSWHAFAKRLFWDFLMGEAFVLATARYSNEYPARFHVVPPWMVNVEINSDGTRSYRIGDLDVTGDIRHIWYEICAGEARGHGPLDAGSYRLVAANALARYATNLASGGGIPSSVLVHPGNLNATQAADLQSGWVAARMSSMGLPAVLSGGIDFKTLSLSPQDMALIELAQFNESRIAVLLGVPPFLMGLPSGGDSMTYSNVESLFDYHWRAQLSTMADAVMSALSGWLLPRGSAIELNRDEYVKAAPLERAQTWQIYLQNNVVSQDQVREAERFSTAAPTQTLTSGVLQ